MTWPEAVYLARGCATDPEPCHSRREGQPRNQSSDKGHHSSSVVRFVWGYWPLQLIVLRVTDFFLDPCCWRGAQAPTDHFHEEPFFPLGVAEIGIVMNVCVPAVRHAPPLDVQAWATKLSPFVPPRGVCVFVPPRLDAASAADCVATHSAGVRRLLLYLHSCRNLGDLF